MSDQVILRVGVQIRPNIEYRPDRAKPYKARVRWTDPSTKKRSSTSESFDTDDDAKAWIERMERAAAQGIDPLTATMSLRDYGDTNMDLALRGLERKTTDPYLAGWRKRVNRRSVTSR